MIEIKQSGKGRYAVRLIAYLGKSDRLIGFSLMSWGYFFDPPPPEPRGGRYTKDIIVLVVSQKTKLSDTKLWEHEARICVNLRYFGEYLRHNCVK